MSIFVYKGRDKIADDKLSAGQAADDRFGRGDRSSRCEEHFKDDRRQN